MAALLHNATKEQLLAQAGQGEITANCHTANPPTSGVNSPSTASFNPHQAARHQRKYTSATSISAIALPTARPRRSASPPGRRRHQPAQRETAHHQPLKQHRHPENSAGVGKRRGMPK
jgi:crotonobetainyl-CoA:carnitine CoA-transferase CaiB-like acyl-CoA transferase